MRRIVGSLFVSVDGVVESPEAWQSPFFDEELGAIVGQSLAASEGFLLGRRTYDEWASFWPTAETPVAPMMNQMPKYVVSTTLESATWHNSTVLRDLSAVAELKQKGDGDLILSGSATLLRALLQERLLEELRLLIHPVLVGRGGRLFASENGQRPLELIDIQRLGSGVVNAAYRPVG
jgi:dihydrofolate reductase